jgi:hypothetical protein
MTPKTKPNQNKTKEKLLNFWNPFTALLVSHCLQAARPLSPPLHLHLLSSQLWHLSPCSWYYTASRLRDLLPPYAPFMFSLRSRVLAWDVKKTFFSLLVPLSSDYRYHSSSSSSTLFRVESMVSSLHLYYRQLPLPCRFRSSGPVAG